MDIRELIQSLPKSYFDNAYSFAEDMYAYDSYQIDNHYARFLLERIVFLRDAASAMGVFREARGLIFAQFVNERLHYPYRVAANWGTFYTTFRAGFTDAEKKEIRDAAAYVSKRIEALPPDRSSHRSVTECRQAMQLILADAPTLPPPDPNVGSPV